MAGRCHDRARSIKTCTQISNPYQSFERVLDTCEDPRLGTLPGSLVSRLVSISRYQSFVADSSPQRKTADVTPYTPTWPVTRAKALIS